jgi:hypothetical protein
MNIQRRYQRWLIGKKARIRLRGAGESMSCTISDVSMSGFKVSMPHKLPVNSFVDCSVVLSDEVSINAQAWVVWHKPAGSSYCYGLYLNRMPQREKEKLNRFMKMFASDQQELAPRRKAPLFEEEGGGHVNDRRIFERFQVDFPASFLDVNDGSEGSAQVTDVSAKGIGITVTGNKEISPRSSLEMWLRIPDKGEPLYTRGQVVWSRVENGEYKSGVNLEKADLMGLSRVLRIRS